jgi:hypothetical protein
MQTKKRHVAWTTPSVSCDGLKLFACVTMLIQNIGITVIGKGMIGLDSYTQQELSQALAKDSSLMVLAGVSSAMQLIGGLAVPIFAYLLVEGFCRTSNYKKYMLRMVCFAVLSEVPYDLANSGKLLDLSSQNALVTMCICLLLLYFLRMTGQLTGGLSVAAKIVITLCGVFWVTLFRAQYGLCVVLLVAVFYVFYTRHFLKTVLGVVISLLYVTAPLTFYGIWCCNEERKDILSKYVYYVFYPLHLLVLGVIVKMM